MYSFILIDSNIHWMIMVHRKNKIESIIHGRSRVERCSICPFLTLVIHFEKCQKMTANWSCYNDVNDSKKSRRPLIWLELGTESSIGIQTEQKLMWFKTTFWYLFGTWTPEKVVHTPRHNRRFDILVYIAAAIFISKAVDWFRLEFSIYFFNVFEEVHSDFSLVEA